MSQFAPISKIPPKEVVLKEVNFYHMGNGLEMSQSALISKIPPKWS